MMLEGELNSEPASNYLCLGQQLGPRSGATKRRAWLGTKPARRPNDSPEIFLRGSLSYDH